MASLVADACHAGFSGPRNRSSSCARNFSLRPSSSAEGGRPNTASNAVVTNLADVTLTPPRRLAIRPATVKLNLLLAKASACCGATVSLRS